MKKDFDQERECLEDTEGRGIEEGLINNVRNIYQDKKTME